ncbi:MAG: flavin reductase family protein [Gemmatimonadaceae bacterium]|nr:flavin reductase family protein [Gemmatimonadaceae bacterium]MDQ3080647.1 flavin reductase family protein [Gemmatimonadota bacterium]
MIDHDAFRAVLGRFTTGVTVVTAIGPDGQDQGMTVSAFCSLSLTPPLVLICIDHTASMYGSLKLASHFVVNILCEDQEALARRFSGTDPNRFDGVGYTRGQTGLAVLDDVLGFVECRVTATQEGGDHDVFFGEVEFAGASDGKPLLYYRGGYAQLER